MLMPIWRYLDIYKYEIYKYSYQHAVQTITQNSNEVWKCQFRLIWYTALLIFFFWYLIQISNLPSVKFQLKYDTQCVDFKRPSISEFTLHQLQQHSEKLGHSDMRDIFLETTKNIGL